MDRAEYDKLDRAEDRMWWFAAVHANLLLLYSRMAGQVAAATLLDAGCGTGGLLRRITAAYPERAAIGLDVDHIACVRAAAKSRRPICAGSLNALPFQDAAFGAIFSVDVLCHRDVDEQVALAQFHRCLGATGILILNLPAYGWMMSRHDQAVYNVRRYTRSGLVDLLQAAGFRVLFSSYWNCVLFPIMVLSRKLRTANAAEGSDVKFYPAPIEAACRIATGFERVLLRCGLRLPFGGSVIVVAAKDAAPGERYA